ncbi:hypothetical protein BD413DRAFT_504828 [Trametes elegans]|nr:hypothetical protein BD413DRAFT_504828 [Trametes elegans]
MALPTIEIVHKAAPEAFRANPTDRALVKDAFDILSAQKGQLQKYYGLEHEDKATTYLFIAWEDLEDHQRLMNDKETYPRLGKAAETFFVPEGGKEAMIHVRPISEPYKAFEAPVVELAHFTVKQGVSKGTLEQTVDTLTKEMNAAGDSEGVVYATWGPTVEKDDTVTIIIGWQSVEAHIKAVTTNPTLSGLVNKLKELADFTLVHVPLKKW